MEIAWRKSSFSEQSDGNCLEIAAVEDHLLLRESEVPTTVIAMQPTAFRAFLSHVKTGEFDHQS